MNRKQDVPGPVCISMRPTLVEQVTIVAKERGFPSRSAFIRAAIERELQRAASDLQIAGLKA